MTIDGDRCLTPVDSKGFVTPLRADDRARRVVTTFAAYQHEATSCERHISDDQSATFVIDRLVSQVSECVSATGRKSMTDLPKRQLGRTGLQITALGYGSMELRGAPRARDTTEAQAETILNAVLDAGIKHRVQDLFESSQRRLQQLFARQICSFYLA
jgi:hypothetical protein